MNEELKACPFCGYDLLELYNHRSIEDALLARAEAAEFRSFELHFWISKKYKDEQYE